MNFTKEKIRELLNPIKIVKIKEVKKHENADKLFITKIDTGSEEKQIVTAATNMKENDLVPFLGVGEEVPGFLFSKGESFTLTARDMRGVVSEGMILAEDEIGLSDDHQGIYIIDGSDDLIGKSILEVLTEEQISSISNPQSNENLAGLKSVTEEILGEETLNKLLTDSEKINHYIGFEISGLVHLGTGLMAGLVIRELQKLGVHTRVFLADWHTWINNKLDGDRDFIIQVAKEYFGPSLQISAQIAGADPEKIEVILGSDLYDKNNRYWQSMIEVSKNLTLSRVVKSTVILGRDESDSMPFAYLIYPSMQVADIYEMGNQIAHAGTDQRKCHVIAREVAEKLNVKPLLDSKDNKIKPIAIHHSLISGLQKPGIWPIPEEMDKKDLVTSMKMSKSVEGSAIFIHDSEDEIRDKIRKAFCPEKEVQYNPILNWCKHLLFPILGKFELKREDKFGGNLTFNKYQELEEAYARGEIFPLDLKNNVAEILIELLKPARDKFKDDKSQEIIERIKSIKKKR